MRMRTSTVDATKAGAVEKELKDLMNQLRNSRDNESTLRELLEAER